MEHSTTTNKPEAPTHAREAAGFQAIRYATRVDVFRSFKEVMTRLESFLSDEGFGILSRIDVDEVLDKKLGVDFQRYCIVGACHPAYAHRALIAQEAIGALMPCNVVVTENDDEHCTVYVTDVDALFSLADHGELETVAAEVAQKMNRVAGRLRDIQPVKAPGAPVEM